MYPALFFYGIGCCVTHLYVRNNIQHPDAVPLSFRLTSLITIHLTVIAFAVNMMVQHKRKNIRKHFQH